jgi:pimeloyl-ACP methyl ester carboxylesterase
MQDSIREAGKSAPESPAGLEPEWARVNDLKVRFAHAGGGPALVLVHGLLGYSFGWRKVIPAFARQFEVFAPDLPGAGFSDCDPTLDCRLSSSANQLVRFLDAVQIDTCDLVAHSYGGATALMLAALAPSRVRRLALVSPANPWSGNGRVRLALLRNPAVAAVFPTLARPMRPLQDYFLRRMWGDPRRLTSEEYLGYSAPIRRVGNLEHAVKMIRTWKADMRELEAVLPQLSHIPTLLVWGSKDRTVDPASAEPMRRNFRSAQLAAFDGVGHLPFEECPEEFSRIVSDFLHSPLSSAVPTGK